MDSPGPGHGPAVGSHEHNDEYSVPIKYRVLLNLYVLASKSQCSFTEAIPLC
jgi:hypothetical protein